MSDDLTANMAAAGQTVRFLVDRIDALEAERDAWMNGVAEAVEPLGFDREAACGPADLLPGLRWLVEARAERDRLREAINDAASELTGVHRPTWASGCVTCFPEDGSWPCISAEVAADLWAVLADSKEAPSDE